MSEKRYFIFNIYSMRHQTLTKVSRLHHIYYVKAPVKQARSQDIILGGR